MKQPGFELAVVAIPILVALAGSVNPQAATPSSLRPETDVAALSGARGMVEVRRAGTAGFAPSRCTTLLAAGDAVRTGKDGAAVLLMADGGRVALGAEGLVTVAPVERPATPGFAALRRALRHVLDASAAPLDRGGYLERGFRQRGAEEQAAIIACAPRTTVRASFPALAMVPGGRPTFRWRLAAPVGRLMVTVTDGRQRKTFWKRPVRDGAESLPYPHDLPALAPGAYLWVITGMVEGHLQKDDGAFMVPDPDRERAAMADLEAAKRLAGGEEADLGVVAACLQHRLFERAEEALRAAWKRGPEDRTLPLLIAYLYRFERDRPPPEEVQPR